MNIITIKTGDFYDNNYTEYLFKTTLDHHKIYDSNLNLTPEFINWLKEYHYDDIVNQYFNNHEYFEIDFWYDDNFDEVIF